MTTEYMFGFQLATQDAIRSQLLTDYMQWQIKKIELDAKAPLQSGHNNPDKAILWNFTEIKELLGSNEWQQYLITETALRYCKGIDVAEPFDLKTLASLEDGKKQLNFEDSMIRYKKSGPRIAVFAASLILDAPTPYVHYSYFYMDIEKNIFPKQTNKDDYEQTTCINSPDINYGENIRKLFFQLITGMNLGQMQQTTISPGQRHEKDRNDSLLNSSQFPITIVTSNQDKRTQSQSFRIYGYSKMKPRNLNKSHIKSDQIKKKSE